MFLDLTKSPEFMLALEKAVSVAGEKLARELKAKTVDPEHVWLTGKEAREYLRMAESTWYAFEKAQEELTAEKREIVISYSLQSRRYQLASLQRFMRKGAVGLPEALPGMADIASNKTNGKLRGVSVRG